MIKKCLISVCLIVTACYSATAQANVMLNVSLTNPFQNASEVIFDIEATFGSTTSDDFVSSLTFGLEYSSAGLLSAGPNPFGRFSLDTTGFPWEGSVDQVNGRVFLDAPDSSDNLVDGVRQTLAKLRISTIGLVSGETYDVTLDSSINEGIGNIDGNSNEVLRNDIIFVDDVKFTSHHVSTIPEPGSLVIFGLCGASMFFYARRRVVSAK